MGLATAPAVGSNGGGPVVVELATGGTAMCVLAGGGLWHDVQGRTYDWAW